MSVFKKKQNFQKYIFPILLLVLISVIITGTYVYKQITTIVNDVTKNSQHDEVLPMVRSVMNDVNSADNSVKSYRLTEDSAYVIQFYSALNRSDDKLKLIKEKSFYQDNKLYLDSFNRLIEDKYLNLSELMEAELHFRVQEALDKMTYQLTPLPEAELYDEIEQNYIRRGQAFLKQLLRSKKNTRDDDITLEQFQKELSELKSEEESIEKLIKTKELILIEKDKFLAKKLQKLVDHFELQAKLKLENKKIAANKAMKRTNRQVILFCITTGLLILLMAYILINFIQNNNRYKVMMNRARKNAIKEAENKERFLANMSHEIRTPINAISGFAEQLSSSKLNKQQAEFIHYIKNSADHLTYVVNDILDLTKMERGKFKFEKLPFELNPVINDCIKLLQPLFDKQQNDHKLSLKTDDNIVLIGDSHRLNQILINLISNANKFTNGGLIQIAVNLEKNSATDCNLLIQVKDNGEGMSQTQLDKIYNEFEQFSTANNAQFKGSGLGLTIVKKLVDQAKGDISFISRLNVGTTVNLKIPYTYTTEAVNKKQETANALVLPTNVLIVDDELYNRKLIIAILEKNRIKYEEATNGEEAVEWSKKDKFDLILMDERMPKMAGIEASKKIRNSSESKNINTPIIAITAAVTAKSSNEFNMIKDCHFLAKPFKEAELLNKIHSVMSDFQESKTNQTMKDKNQELINFKDLAELSNGSVDFYKDMLETFLSGVKEGFESIDIAFKDKNTEKLKDIAHKMSAPCRHLSAMNFLASLKAIENSSSDKKLKPLIKSAKKEFSYIEKIVIDELKDLKNF